MDEEPPFVDFYEMLEVSPDCDDKALETAYRHLAKIYHPDHAETADVAKFKEVLEAYRILHNPESREKYDKRYREHVAPAAAEHHTFDNIFIEDNAALSDAEAHEKILLTLYKKRREDAKDPGVMAYYIQQYLKCTDEIFEFHVWYLKEKGYIERTEQNTLAITIAGVDHVISMTRTKAAEPLRIDDKSAHET